MEGVLVLNKGYEPLHRVSVQHAIRMLVRGVAEVEKAVEGQNFGHFPMPAVFRLINYVQLKWRKANPRWSRRRLLARDKYKCGYCGKEAQTVDHIMPTTRGGTSTWKNTAAACFKCNNCKDDQLPNNVRPCSDKTHMACRSGMKLRITPFVPTWWQVEEQR